MRTNLAQLNSWNGLKNMSSDLGKFVHSFSKLFLLRNQPDSFAASLSRHPWPFLLPSSLTVPVTWAPSTSSPASRNPLATRAASAPPSSWTWSSYPCNTRACTETDNFINFYHTLKFLLQICYLTGWFLIAGFLWLALKGFETRKGSKYIL